MMRNVLIAIALGLSSIVAASGCSGGPRESTGAASESLGITVHLPHALGGGDRVTHYAEHVAPSRVYPVGLVATPRKAGTGVIKVQSPTSSLPTSIDLSANAPSPGDQGSTGSCAAWATGYSSMGWWASKTGLGGAPYAPMYLYAQEVNGACDQGTSIEGNMNILQQQGIDTDADYQPMESNLDCATQPSSAQTANAANYKITGYQQLDLTDARQAIEAELSAGHPVVLGIMAYPELMNANAQSYLVGPPQAGETLYGGHAIAAFKYDDNGVWILNSWTSGWGKDGWAELSWSFLLGSLNGQANLMDAAAITGVVGGGNAPPPLPPPPPQSNGPRVGFDSPTSGAVVAPGGAVDIVVTATDSSAIASASLDWQSPSGHATFALQSKGNGQWGATLTLSTSAAPGTRTLTVTVTDASSQSASTTETIEVQ